MKWLQHGKQEHGQGRNMKGSDWYEIQRKPNRVYAEYWNINQF